MIILIGTQTINAEDVSIVKPNGANATLVMYDGQNLDVALTPANAKVAIDAAVPGGHLSAAIAVSGITGPVYVAPRHVERVVANDDGLGSILLFKRPITTITAPAVKVANMLTLLNAALNDKTGVGGWPTLVYTPSAGTAAADVSDPSYIGGGKIGEQVVNLAFSIVLNIDNGATASVDITGLPLPVEASGLVVLQDVLTVSGDDKLTYAITRQNATTLDITASGAATGATVVAINAHVQYRVEAA